MSGGGFGEAVNGFGLWFGWMLGLGVRGEEDENGGGVKKKKFSC